MHKMFLAYGSPTDTTATISGANYFLSMYADLSVGDWILVNGTDASEILGCTNIFFHRCNNWQFAASGTVGTANIINNAVTYAKIQEASAGSVLLGNPTGGAANYSEVTLGNGIDLQAQL